MKWWMNYKQMNDVTYVTVKSLSPNDPSSSSSYIINFSFDFSINWVLLRIKYSVNVMICALR